MMMFVVGGNGLTVADVSHTWHLNHMITGFTSIFGIVLQRPQTNQRERSH